MKIIEMICRAIMMAAMVIAMLLAVVSFLEGDSVSTTAECALAISLGNSLVITRSKK